MKIRNGFVSNSSSSSFIVAFPLNPKSMEDVKDVVFGNREWYVNPYGYYQDNDTPRWSAEFISKIIWEDMKNQIPNNRKFICSKLDSIIDYVDFELPNKSGSRFDNIDWEAWERAKREKIDDFMINNGGSFFYYFLYSDQDGTIYSAMEHGDLFKDLPHLVSNDH